MIEHKLRRCEADDPNRCTAMGKHGQCPYISMKALDPEKYPTVDKCQRHGGGMAKNEELKRVRNYRIQIWNERLSEFADHPEVKSLRDEIGLIRILIETIMNKCKNDTDLLIYSPQISDLVMRLEKLVASASRLESRSSTNLDRTSALQFAAKVVEIITEHIDDPEIIDSISGDISEFLTT